MDSADRSLLFVRFVSVFVSFRSIENGAETKHLNATRPARLPRAWQLESISNAKSIMVYFTKKRIRSNQIELSRFITETNRNKSNHIETSRNKSRQVDTSRNRSKQASDPSLAPTGPGQIHIPDPDVWTPAVMPPCQLCCLPGCLPALPLACLVAWLPDCLLPLPAGC